MTSQDQKFFDAYKRLDKLCKEIYGSNGVSSYIDDMDSKDSTRARYVDSWYETRKKLQELRHKRNILAHEEVLNQISEEDDIKFLEMFRESIISQRDPIAIYSRLDKKKNKPKKAQLEIDYMEIENVDEKASPLELAVFFTALLGTIACVIGVAFYYLK